nr:hypothetical protein [Mycolicibacterium alvei]
MRLEASAFVGVETAENVGAQQNMRVVDHSSPISSNTARSARTA